MLPIPAVQAGSSAGAGGVNPGPPIPLPARQPDVRFRATRYPRGGIGARSGVDTARTREDDSRPAGMTSTSPEHACRRMAGGP